MNPSQDESRQLGRLIEDAAGAAGRPAERAPSLWQRLDMEQLARRVIETARLATGEHAMRRLHEAMRRRDQAGKGEE